jgi:hypothetical protein
MPQYWISLEPEELEALKTLVEKKLKGWMVEPKDKDKEAELANLTRQPRMPQVRDYEVFDRIAYALQQVQIVQE